MGARIPLAPPFLAGGQLRPGRHDRGAAGGRDGVDVRPFSTNGAQVLTSAQDVDRDRFFRQLMARGGIIVAVAPLAAWLVLIVPGFG